MDASKKQREPVAFKSLAELKRFIRPGVELKTVSHANHADMVGLTRVVTTVQTVGFYSKIKDQPEHPFSTCNHGKGFYTDFGKAGNYIFDGTTVKVKDTRKQDRGVIYELWRENVSGEFSDILLDCLSNDVAGAIMSISGLALLDPNAKRSFLTRLAYMQKQRPEYRRDALVELARAARAQFGLSKPSEQDDFYDKIVNYVKEHYSDPMLSVESICAHFGRSHNTVYSVVKDRSGEGVLYLINTVRLRRAKELLLQPGATVEKAAQAVGLSSALALFRIFKRYEGVTPSHFIPLQMRSG